MLKRQRLDQEMTLNNVQQVEFELYYSVCFNLTYQSGALSLYHLRLWLPCL